MTQWIHKWKRNGWKNAKKGRVANATLSQELESAIARHSHVELTWVKAHSGILLNESVHQLATRGVAGDSYIDNIPVTPVPPEEPESTEEFDVTDEDATQMEDLEDTNMLPPFGMVVESIGLAAEAQRTEQEEMIRRFKPSPVSAILRRAMEQPPQPEITLFPDESSSSSAIPSPRDK
jgi:hypothetical protein